MYQMNVISLKSGQNIALCQLWNSGISHRPIFDWFSAVWKEIASASPWTALYSIWLSGECVDNYGTPLIVCWYFIEIWVPGWLIITVSILSVGLLHMRYFSRYDITTRTRELEMPAFRPGLFLAILAWSCRSCSYSTTVNSTAVDLRSGCLNNLWFSHHQQFHPEQGAHGDPLMGYCP